MRPRATTQTGRARAHCRSTAKRRRRRILVVARVVRSGCICCWDQRESAQERELDAQHADIIHRSGEARAPTLPLRGRGVGDVGRWHLRDGQDAVAVARFCCSGVRHRAVRHPGRDHAQFALTAAALLEHRRALQAAVPQAARDRRRRQRRLDPCRSYRGAPSSDARHEVGDGALIEIGAGAVAAYERVPNSARSKAAFRDPVLADLPAAPRCDR